MSLPPFGEYGVVIPPDAIEDDFASFTLSDLADLLADLLVERLSARVTGVEYAVDQEGSNDPVSDGEVLRQKQG